MAIELCRLSLVALQKVSERLNLSVPSATALRSRCDDCAPKPVFQFFGEVARTSGVRMPVSHFREQMRWILGKMPLPTLPKSLVDMNRRPTFCDEDMGQVPNPTVHVTCSIEDHEIVHDLVEAEIASVVHRICRLSAFVVDDAILLEDIARVSGLVTKKQQLSLTFVVWSRQHFGAETQAIIIAHRMMKRQLSICSSLCLQK